jgi:antitoxin (DNA-binding transcriptional repressor) of toxin-antitoxin stability system
LFDTCCDGLSDKPTEGHGEERSVIVDGCVSVRELIRGSSGWFSEVERNGKVFAISRYGRLVALVTPLPERMTLEFADVIRRTNEEDLDTGGPDDVSADDLVLSDEQEAILREGLAGASGWWDAPSDRVVWQWVSALSRLEIASLVKQTAGGYRLTRRGRRVAERLSRSRPSERGPG